MAAPWEKYSKSSGASDGPWAKFGAAKQAEPKPDVSLQTMGESALQGFGEGALAGYLPQAQSLLGALVPDPTAELDAKLKSEGFNVEQPKEDYLTRRDYFLEREQRLKEQAPGSFVAGLIPGAIASGAATGAGAARLPMVGKSLAAPSAGLIGRVGKATLGGAAQGFVQNPGDELGKVEPGQLSERVQNAKTGALFGGLAQSGAEVASATGKALKSIPDKIKSYGEVKAFKSAGPMLKDFRKAFGKNKVNELGAEMIEGGMVNPGDTFADIADKSKQAKQAVGARIGEIYDKFKGAVKIDTQSMTTDLVDAVIDPKIMPKVGADKYGEAMLEVISDIERAGGDINDVRALNDIIGEIDTKINFSKRANELPVIQQGYMAIRNRLRDRITSLADEYGKAVGEGAIGAELKALNRKYSNLIDISSIASDRVARENANRFMSLTDTIAGVGGAAAGAGYGAREGGVEGAIKGAAMGAGVGLLNKGARLYGNPMLSRGAYALGKGLKAIPSPVSSGLIGAAAPMLAKPFAGGAAAAQLAKPEGLIGRRKQ